MIVRRAYQKKLELLIDTEFIKVITGVRRSGKSFLLKMLVQMLEKRGVRKEQILYLNFENPKFDELLHERKLYEYTKEHLPKEGKVYLLFDEIQEVFEWQRQVNGMRVAFDADIYITGSNAALLSGELATYLTGRFVEISMFPLSLREYLLFRGIDESVAAREFPTYLTYGGFPSVALQENEQLKRDILQGIFQSILWRDIALRAQIRDGDALQRVVLFLVDNIGNSISTSKIASTLRSSGKKISINTVDGYLKLLEEAFLFYKAQRFDIRGKEYLQGQAKYYLCDTGIIASAIKKTHSNRGSKIENLVYLELKRRGYEVFVGKFEEKEIDFVAVHPEQTLYIQVTDRLPDKSQRETDNLLHLPTGHKKVVITNNWENVGVVEGIDIVHIIDFLLQSEG